MNFAFLPIAVVGSGRGGAEISKIVKNIFLTTYLKSLKKATNNAQIENFDIFQKKLKNFKFFKN